MDWCSSDKCHCIFVKSVELCASLILFNRRSNTIIWFAFVVLQFVFHRVGQVIEFEIPPDERLLCIYPMEIKSVVLIQSNDFIALIDSIIEICLVNLVSCYHVDCVCRYLTIYLRSKILLFFEWLFLFFIESIESLSLNRNRRWISRLSALTRLRISTPNQFKHLYSIIHFIKTTGMFTYIESLKFSTFQLLLVCLVIKVKCVKIYNSPKSTTL